MPPYQHFRQELIDAQHLHVGDRVALGRTAQQIQHIADDPEQPDFLLIDCYVSYARSGDPTQVYRVGRSQTVERHVPTPCP